MSRMARLALHLSVVALLLLPGQAAAENGSQHRLADLPKPEQKALVEAARAYFDPEREFLWRPRKEFRDLLEGLAEDGIDAYQDMRFLKDVVYQGRHFLDPFSDKAWQRANGVKFKKTSVYLNVMSEALRFTYSEPKGYPTATQMRKILRQDPYPLLVSMHEVSDCNEDHWGAEVLSRRFPRQDFRDLYDTWLTLAPWAARAKFLEDDGAIRHDFFTHVLREFWTRYHVDFDRIILDGTEPATVVAAAHPFLYAGLILRGGEIDSELVPNYANVPIYVVGDESLREALVAAGHPDVTLGNGEGVFAWMNERRRTTPTTFEWAMRHTDQEIANWIEIYKIDVNVPVPTLRVQVLDTEADPNTLRIDAVAIEQVNLFLNDEIVDLGREVRLVLNGHEETIPAPGRDFGKLFDKGQNVRKNMLFGWLYPAFLREVTIKPAEGGAAPPEEATPPSEEPAPTGSEEDEAQAALFWEKAQEAEADGNPAKARIFYQKVVDVGVTSYKPRAEEKLALLDDSSGD